VNPFDLKAALLAKHAQHVVLIHFPIGLFLTSFAFDLLGLWRRDRTLATAAYYNLIAAAVAALPAVATGLLAWHWLYGGKRLRGNLRLHLVFGVLSAGMIWVLCGWRTWRERKQRQSMPRVYLAAELVAAAIITLTGHLGGILSGVDVPMS
jgi:uncharacterized membrane protein